MTTHETPIDSRKNGALTLDDALQRIAAAITPVKETESVSLHDALGRVLAIELCSPIDVPGHRNSAMDGYAVCADDLPAEGERRLRVTGSSFAGHPYAGTLGSGETVRIMTGAVVPDGADTVVMQEHVQRHGDEIVVGSGHKRGQNVRLPGEDIRKDTVVLARGRRLVPADLGLLASLGISRVEVRRRVRVAFFSTGDELCALGETLGAGQVYDSNRYTLWGMLARLGAEVVDLGIVRDDRDAIRAAFRDGAAGADVLITSGGVSVGEADFVKETLDEMGQVSFWKIAMKPGKPLAFGRVGDALFFGLPGNPVSAMATFYQVVQPSLQHLAGESHADRLRLRVPLATRLKRTPGRVDFQRGILERDNEGNLTVRGAGLQGSHVLSGMSRANCFIVLAAGSGDVEPGTVVDVEPFAGFM